jgi:hypothetical protein
MKRPSPWCDPNKSTLERIVAAENAIANVAENAAKIKIILMELVACERAEERRRAQPRLVGPEDEMRRGGVPGLELDD